MDNCLRDQLIHFNNVLSTFDEDNLSSEIKHMINEMATFCSTYEICSSILEEMLERDSLLKSTCINLSRLFSIYIFNCEMRSSRICAVDKNQTLIEYSKQRQCYEQIIQSEIDMLKHLGVHLISNDENDLLRNKIAFIGSGPMPISSMIIVNDHAPFADIYNIDMNQEANQLASIITKQILPSQVWKRMHFITQDITEKPLPRQVKSILNECQLIYIAAFVGENELNKLNILENIVNQSNNQSDKKTIQYFLIRTGDGLCQVLFPKITPQKIETLQTNVNDDNKTKFLFQIKSVFHSPDSGMTHIIAKTL